MTDRLSFMRYSIAIATKTNSINYYSMSLSLVVEKLLILEKFPVKNAKKCNSPSNIRDKHTSSSLLAKHGSELSISSPIELSSSSFILIEITILYVMRALNVSINFREKMCYVLNDHLL